MAENRLLRENNPEPGERRGYVPQHLEAGSQEYSKTEGSDGRLHTKSMIVDQNGEPFAKENPVPVQLTGSKVERMVSTESVITITAGSSITIHEGDHSDVAYQYFLVGANAYSSIDARINVTYWPGSYRKGTGSRSIKKDQSEIFSNGSGNITSQVYSGFFEVIIDNAGESDGQLSGYHVLGVK